MQSSIPLQPKIIRTTKDQKIACAQCTFLNLPDATNCGMCAADIKPPTHIIQPNGMWKCGYCNTLNRKGLKECSNNVCNTPFYSTMISTAPSQIFCTRCGFLNDGDNTTCVQCDLQLRSTFNKLSTDLRDSTNLLARDMGMNMNVKCPGCSLVCFVPPATAGLRCGTCHTYFASPTVGEMTNFHMTRLASSITISFRGFFRRTSDVPVVEEVPVGRLIAIGHLAPRPNSTEETTLDSSASFELQEEDGEGEEKSAVVEALDEHKAESTQSSTLSPVAVETSNIGADGEEKVQVQTTEVRLPVSPRKPTRTLTHPHAMAVAVAVPTSHKRFHTTNTKSSSVPTALALPASHVDDIYEVEGDIVEL